MSNSTEATKEGYTRLSDGTVDLMSIPAIKKCNVCLLGMCEDCPESTRCHCAKYNHGAPK